MSLPQNTEILNGNIAFFNSTNKHNFLEFKKVEVVSRVIGKQNIYPKQRLDMLKKYRRYVQEYSELCTRENEYVFNYNVNVETFIEQNQLHELSTKETFQLNYDLGKVSIQEYNKAVEIKNAILGMKLIKQKEYTPVKKPVEQTFAMILFKYSMQIKQRNTVLDSLPGLTTTRSIQKIKINPHELTNTVIDGVLTLPYSKRTIQNHVNRLIEAGVLFNYEFNGYKRPCEYHVNSQILTVFDDLKQKTLSSENELFKFSFEKNLRYKEIVTRTKLNNNNIIEIVDKQQPQSNDFKTVKNVLKNNFQFAYANNKNLNKNTDSANATKNKPAPNIYLQKSDFLRKNIKDRYEFVNQLSNGVFDNYKFRQQRLLFSVANYGDLLKSEFLEVLVQEFMKITAPMYKDKSVVFGSWNKSYDFIKELFLNNNNSIPGHVVLLHRFEALFWRINKAKSYFRSNNNDSRVLFPGQYFDPTRKSSKSGGFAYTLVFWKRYQESISNQQKIKAKQEYEAKQRNKKYKAIHLIDQKIKQLKNGKITLEQLQDYVTDHASIPFAIKAKLPEYIFKAYKC